MRNFGASEKMTSMMERFGLKDGEELEHPWLNKSVETAQKRVEQRNYLIRKRTLDFDDVMNKQREVVYALRNETLETSEPRKLIFEIVDEVIPLRVQEYLQPPDGTEPDFDGLLQWVNTTFPLGLNRSSAQFDTRTPEANSQYLVDRIKQSYEWKVSHEESEAVAGLERYIILNAIDRLWQEHLYAMDGLREGIYLRSYGQKDPLVEYKAEAYDMFSHLMAGIKNEVLSNLFRSTTNLMAFEQFLSSLPFNIAHPRPESGQLARTPTLHCRAGKMLPWLYGEPSEKNGDELQLVIPAARREAPKVGRNDACPCGSGKKYKNCCGRMA